jgi:predicted nicotinamide N-methyase
VSRLRPTAGPGTSAIVAACTAFAPVPLVPEISLRLASEPIAAWQHTERALGRTGLPPPFWAFAWAGGQALARFVLDHPATVAGRRVIDLASGSGLVAIAAARAGAARVTAYDTDPLALAAITVNAAANGVDIATGGEDILVPGGQPPPGTDGVLVADAFYERGLAGRVMRFLAGAHGRGTAVLGADPGRAYLPRTGLRPLMSYDVPGVAEVEDSATKRATVWELTPPGQPG